MHLPVRTAVSIPVGVETVIGCVYALLNGMGTRLPLWIRMYQLSGMTLVAGAVSLLFVLPNALAMTIANRTAGGDVGAFGQFALCFAAVVIVAWFAQAALLDRTLNGVGGFPTKVTDPKTWMLILADIGVCLLTALWARRFDV